MIGDDALTQWVFKFPKLNELMGTVNRSAYKGWFADLPSKASLSDLSISYFEKLESNLTSLDSLAWSDFSHEIRAHANDNRKKLMSMFDEVAGYIFLKGLLNSRSIAHDCIRQPARAGTATKSQSPDWIAWFHNSPIAALEVKTAFESDDQTNYISNNTHKIHNGELPEVRRIHPSISSGLFNKISSDVDVAKRQLKTVPGRPSILAIYVILNVDIEPSQLPDCRERLDAYLQSLAEDNVMIVGDFRSPFFD